MQVLVQKNILKTTLVITGVVFVVFCIVWYRVAQDTLCLVRTETEPKSVYSENIEVFKEDALRVREKAQESLISQFDSEHGFFIYEQRPNGSIPNTNNDIRQLVASRIVAQDSVHDESLREIHQINLDAIMAEWYREEGGLGYVFADEKSKLGANAMLLRTLTASPFFAEYTHEAEALVLGINAIQHKDGSFRAWFKEPSYAFDEAYLLTFYSGEAILALLEYYEKTGNEMAYSIAVRAQDFYINEYVTRMDENYYPAYVPWHTLSLAHLYRETGDTKYRDAIVTLTDELLETQDTEVFIGRFYNPRTPEYGSPHVSSDAVYTEGLAVAYDIVLRAGFTEKGAEYKQALIRAFHNLESLQFRNAWYRVFDDREVAERLSGGFMTHACNPTVRIDSTAHAIDALDNILRVF